MKSSLVMLLALGVTLSGVENVAFAQEKQKEADSIWGSAEFLFMSRKGSDLPPLVTTSPPGVNGVIGTGPKVLFGDERVNDDWNPGFRVTLGGWLDSDQKVGLFGRFFHLGEISQGFRANSDNLSTHQLSRPFYNADPVVNHEDALILASPGVRSATVHDEVSNNILGGDLMVRANCVREENWGLDFIGGYQYTRIEDGLSMRSSMLQTAGGFTPAGTRFGIHDKFEVANNFHGVPLGVMAEAEKGPWTFSALGKMGLGVMEQDLSIHGSTIVTTPGGSSTTSAGGLFALPTNSGSRSRDVFAWVPELGVTVGYQVTKNFSVVVGYSAMFWSSVALAGDQVDRAINGSQLLGGSLVGPARPKASFNETSYWVHGVQAGATFRF